MDGERYCKGTPGPIVKTGNTLKPMVPCWRINGAGQISPDCIHVLFFKISKMHYEPCWSI